jgi:hypothetical protein
MICWEPTHVAHILCLKTEKEVGKDKSAEQIKKHGKIPSKK